MSWKRTFVYEANIFYVVFYLFLRASHGVANTASMLKYSIRCLEHALIWSLKEGRVLVEGVVIIRQDTLGYNLQE